MSSGDVAFIVAAVGGILWLVHEMRLKIRSEREDIRQRKEEWGATLADSRCGLFLRMLTSSGYRASPMLWHWSSCEYCEQHRLAFVHGPRKMETPTGETFVQENRYHGVACLRCGYLSLGAASDPYAKKLSLLAFLESQGLPSRGAYEAELERLATLVEDTREKLRQLPPVDPYREPARLPDSTDSTDIHSLPSD
jgi:hypothetical protein